MIARFFAVKPKGAAMPSSMHLMLVLLAALMPGVAAAQEPPRPVDTSAFGKPGADCAELRYVEMTTSENAPIQVTDARPFATPDGMAYCQVEGYLSRATRFRVRWPLTTWNGKLVVLGTGGMAGGLPNDNPAGGRGGSELKRGFATVQHDGGHYSTIADAKWAFNDAAAQIDFAFRAPHAATMAGKAILTRATGRAPQRTYYCGCSNGGREALMMAQHYPYEFDGIVAGAPSIVPRDLFLNMLYVRSLVRDQSRAGFDMAAARTLHAGVIGQCDRLDGKVDGIIDDPRRCRVDFRPLMCAEQAREECLTERQADIARRIYAGPRTKEGRQIAPSSAFPGSEISWVAFVTPRWSFGYVDDVLRYLMFDPAPGAVWTPDVADIADYAKHMGTSGALLAANNPDLREFKAHGGKLLAYYGWTDGFGGARAAIDYYETAARVIGNEAAAQDFFRLFMIPGMDHCSGGAGASVFDFVGEIDHWVESGKPPTAITGFHPGKDGKPEFTRSVMPYRAEGIAR